MSNVIKRRHTNQYAQIHNNPLQNDLVDLRAIGLLSHLMSLPSDWVIYKTQLYKKFSRKNIDAAWKELASKNYIIGFNCYVNGKKQSYYNVSDIPFLYEEFREFVLDTCFELKNSGLIVKSLNSMKDGSYVITVDLTDVLIVHQSNPTENITTVPLVQYSKYSTESTSTKKDIQKKYINDDDDIPNVIHSATKYPKTKILEIQKHDIPIGSKSILSQDDLLLISNKVRDMYKGQIQKRSFDSVLKKCNNNYRKGTVPNYENYLITSIDNKITELESRRKQEKNLLDFKTKSKQINKKIYRKEMIPEWLHEQKEEQIGVSVENKSQQSEEDITIQRERLLETLNKYKKRS